MSNNRISVGDIVTISALEMAQRYGRHCGPTTGIVTNVGYCSYTISIVVDVDDVKAYKQSEGNGQLK